MEYNFEFSGSFNSFKLNEKFSYPKIIKTRVKKNERNDINKKIEELVTPNFLCLLIKFIKFHLLRTAQVKYYTHCYMKKQFKA